MSDIDIKIRLEAAKAEAELAKLNAQMSVLEQKEQQAILKTDALTKKLNADLANAANKASLQQQKLTATIEQQAQTFNQRHSAAVQKAASQQELASLKADKLRAQIDKLNASAQSQGLNVFNISLASFIGNLTSRAVTFGVTTIINSISGIITKGREFEDGLVSVGKTTGIAGNDLQKFGNEITNLSKQIPLSSKELLGLATTAGQLGLKSSSDILQFTETLGKLQLATDIAGEEGSQSVAKILTITGELEKNGTENIDKFGNVITRLGNNFAATEGQILAVANRVAQGTAAFNIASEDVLAIATALKATGSEAEASGTAIQKTFRLIGEATQEGGIKLRNFANAAGLTDQAFIDLFKRDPAKLFLQLTKNLGQTTTGGAELNKTLGDLGLSDERLVRTLNPLITRYKTLENAISDARREAEDKVALDEEARKASDTLSGDLQRLSSAYEALTKQIFNGANPALRDLTKALTNFITNLTTFVNSGTFDKWNDRLKTFIDIALKGDPTLSALGVTLSSLSGLVEDNADAYSNLSKESRAYLDTLADPLLANAGGNFVEIGNGLEQLKQNYIETNEVIVQSNRTATQRLGLFEQEKLNLLKKFFKDEEILRLEAKFKTIENLKEQEEFSKFVIQEAEKRQRDAFAATLGLDKATLEAKKAFQQELKKIADEEKQLLEQKQILEEENNLLTKEKNQIFLDERLIAVQDFLTRQEQIEIQAGINAESNEAVRQNLILAAQIKGEQARISAAIKAQEDLKNIEKVSNDIIEKDNKELLEQKIAFRRADVQSFRSASDLITAIAGKENKAAFAISKAAAFAENIIRTQQEIATVRAAFAYAPPVAEALAAKAQVQGVIRGATILATAVQGFENGGIVGGSSFTGDRIGARVNSGEMILNRQQQSQLFAMANGSNGQSGAQEITINTRVELDNEVVGRATSRWVANGGQLGEVQ